ncbi:MAG: uroporphyrinogen decarboxylase family protein [Phycisphaeraceae bacterium]
MTPRNNILKAARFDHPDAIPVTFHIAPAAWHFYPQDQLKHLMADHPALFPNGPPKDTPHVPHLAPWRTAGVRYRDSWGCVWETNEDGVTGTVIEHPLADPAALETFVPPDPAGHWGWGPMDWKRCHAGIAAARAAGQLAAGELRHGHTFLTATYLRGYESLLLDMADQAPSVERLFDMITDFNLGVVQCFLQAKVEWLGYPEDLGMQVGPMMSVQGFRRYILPAYRRIMTPAQQVGAVIHMHSDGDIRLLADDLIGLGVHVLNVQDRVNGIDWIAEHLKGRVAIDLDLDRQFLTRTGSPKQIRAWVESAVQGLSDPAGGLMLKHDLSPGPSLEQVAAIMTAMQDAARR